MKFTQNVCLGGSCVNFFRSQSMSRGDVRTHDMLFRSLRGRFDWKQDKSNGAVTATHMRTEQRRVCVKETGHGKWGKSNTVHAARGRLYKCIMKFLEGLPKGASYEVQ